MNWLSNITPPGIKSFLKRQEDNADKLWVKCDGCGEMIFHRDFEAAQNVCPSCNHHTRLPVDERFKLIFDDGAYEPISAPQAPVDPLKFKDEKKYIDRLKDYRKRTGASDAMTVGKGTIEGAPAVVAVQNFAFMGGSMGTALGEAFVAAAERAVADQAPMIVFTASGGARMQEGILSLMQMPRTTVAVQMLKEAGLPYIVVFTHPTTGGVTASYAMLGDVHMAEPGALIGFAGARVIEQTIREKLPEGFQRAEFLQEKGMVDMVVHRHQLKSSIAKLLRVLTKSGAQTVHTEATLDMIEPAAQNKSVIQAQDVASDLAANDAGSDAVAQNGDEPSDGVQADAPGKSVEKLDKAAE